MKLSYADPRPYWVGQNVLALQCSSSFGNPSGHSETSMAMAMTVWLDYANVLGVTNSRKIITFCLVILFSFSIGYSRLILGVHSLDQIIYGLSLGVWIAFTMQYCVRPDLDPHIKQLVSNKIKQFKELFLANFIIVTLIIGGQMFDYAIMSGRVMIDDIWITNMESKCGPVNFNKSFANNILAGCGTAAIACGGYFGLLIQAKFYKGITQYSLPLDKSILKFLGRVGVTLLMVAPVMALLLI